MSNQKPIDSVAWNGALVRPKYSRGQLLEDDDLTAGVTYTRDLMKLMFRSLFGCGVICGLKVVAQPECNHSRVSITVGRGLGLDCSGNPIEVARTETLHYDPQCKRSVSKLWVVACYREQPCRPREATCSGDEEEQIVHTRVYSGYSLSILSEQPECACSCEPPDSGAHSVVDDECCKEEKPHVPDSHPAESAAADADVREHGRGHCACYKKHYAHECECEDCKCIVLARIDIAVADNGSIKAATADASVRRLIRPALIAAEACRPPRTSDTPTPPKEPPSMDGPIIVT